MDRHTDGALGSHSGQDRGSRETVAARSCTLPRLSLCPGKSLQSENSAETLRRGDLLLEQRYQAAPHAENLYDLAEALQTAGRTDEAKRVFAQFEQASLLETNRADNSNRELIFYYADYAHEPVQALDVANREFARRHDAFTLDGYAWALYVNGRYQEARAQIEKALVVGLRDARLMRHAGEIALKAGDRASAERYLRQATDLNTVESEPARAALARLSSSPAQR